MPTINKVAWVHISDRKVLYVRSQGKDIFYNPGGKPENGESDVEALVREIREELGVAIRPETTFYCDTFSAPAHGHSPDTFVEIRCYTATYSGELTPGAEIEELAWFTSQDRERTTATGKQILDWLQTKNVID